MIDLLERVARHLTGRPVRVVLRRIEEPGVGGYCTRGADGIIRITVDSGLRDDDFLRLFLHEVAHAKLHSERMRAIGASPEATRQRAAMLRQVVDKASLAAIDASTRQQEREADELADRWLLLAERYQTTGGSWLVSRLNGLLTRTQ